MTSIMAKNLIILAFGLLAGCGSPGDDARCCVRGECGGEVSYDMEAECIRAMGEELGGRHE